MRLIETIYSFVPAIVVLLLIAFFVGCGSSDDVNPEDGEGLIDGDEEAEQEWNPDGDYDSENCVDGYGGYGDDCTPPDTGLDCSQDPCVFGECVESGGESRCVCREGYDGVLCDRCAEGYGVQGLRCVLSGVCEDYPCVFGTCIVVNEEPVCECDTGYSGDFCDRCADGYHVENLACVEN